ncbi:uncharacterized protein LOC130047875 [Ostrea edulis]|uniref:uncharacterized protein LOC130047875 n=1 Tax=Ostrea edulis TaxID=37623 RepID=UPI0024AEFC01|nr:uncharacterized protein LOC130047875 [Ostrea edulis]
MVISDYQRPHRCNTCVPEEDRKRMNTNKDGWSLVLWLSLAVLHAAEAWTWFEAQKLCRENNDSLLNPRMHNLPKRNYSYWTGDYRRYSFRIKILDCYKEHSNDATQNFQMDIPSAGFCQEICATMNSSIFGIKDEECKCFKTLPVDKPVKQKQCAVTPQTDKEIKFAERGGEFAYTLYESDFNVTERGATTCVAVQCQEKKQFYFHSDCSLPFQAVCKNAVSKSNQSWKSSMEICKDQHSSYLVGNVSLNDVYQTCDRLDISLTSPSWIGVAKEVYYGYDRGIPIHIEETGSFLGCGQCDYRHDCSSFVECTERVDAVLCEKGFSTRTTEPTTAPHKTGTHSITPSSDISTQTSESVTAGNRPRTTQTFTSILKTSIYTSETSIKDMLPISTTSSVFHTNKRDVTNSSDTLSIVLPLVMTSIFIGCFATGTILYIRRKKILENQNNKQLEPNDTDNNYTDIDIDVKNKNYFVLEPQSETNYSSSHIVQTDESNPYKDTAEGVYDHLRDKESRKRNEKDGKYNYSNPYKETDGRLYHHIRDTEFGKSTAENHYDHAPHAAEQDYSAHGGKASDTEYDHAMSFYDYKQHNQVIEETDGGYAKTVTVS